MNKLEGNGTIQVTKSEISNVLVRDKNIQLLVVQLVILCYEEIYYHHKYSDPLSRFSRRRRIKIIIIIILVGEKRDSPPRNGSIKLGIMSQTAIKQLQRDSPAHGGLFGSGSVIVLSIQ